MPGCVCVAEGHMTLHQAWLFYIVGLLVFASRHGVAHGKANERTASVTFKSNMQLKKVQRWIFHLNGWPRGNPL